MCISKVYTRIEPKASVSWPSNSVNCASMLLRKDIWKNFTKTIFSLRDVIKYASGYKTVVPTQPVTLMQNLNNTIICFNNQLKGKYQMNTLSYSCPFIASWSKHRNNNRRNDNDKKVILIKLMTTIYFTNH